MRPIVAIAARDLRQRLRDRSIYLICFVAPLALAAVFSLTGGEITLDARFAVYNADRGPAGQALVDGPLNALVESGQATVSLSQTRDAAERAVRDRRRHAAFLIGGDFSERLAGGGVAQLDVFVSDTGSFETILAPAVARSFARSLEATELSVATAIRLQPTGAAPSTLRQEAQMDPAPVAVRDAPVELKQVSMKTTYAAGMAVFFVFFAVQFSFISLHGERRDGTLARMLATPIRPSSVVIGKGIVGLGIGLVTVAVLIVASDILLGAEWGSPAGVALLSVATVTAAMGVMGASAMLARTYEQAAALGLIVASTLGILGGSFFPVFLGPGYLATVSLITPHAWWIRGLGELQPSGAGVADVLPSAAVLFGFGFAGGAFAVVRAGRMVAR